MTKSFALNSFRPPGETRNNEEDVEKNHRFSRANSSSTINSMVDVDDAMEKYGKLKRELSQVSRQASVCNNNDIKLEEGTITEDEFVLDDYLRNWSNQSEQAGLKAKALGVVWRNLTVEGLGTDAHTIPTLLSSATKILTPWKFFGIGDTTTRKTILNNLTGFCKEGEMLLVLGRPGSGCTSLLNVLANMRSSYTKIDGQVNYGGIDHEEFAKRYRGQVAYNSEEDQHYPTLTTKQTLQFALRTKTPGTRLPEETKQVFINKIIFLLGSMLGLTKKMNTAVGDAFLRGLSGGERKRLSIAEVMTTQSAITCWDCSTRGLDAASAYDYAKSLRIMTNILSATTIASLYQASDFIFSLFDKVLLLDQGRCLYFGPVTEAKAYFEDLGFYCQPRKSTPDFLTGLCNPAEREIQQGIDPNTVPRHASDFERAYQSSDMYQRMLSELQEYENRLAHENHAQSFKDAVDEEKQKYAFDKQPYIASFYQQVKALVIRQSQLLVKDRESLMSRYTTVLVVSLITASCFFKLPLNGTGAFGRSGVLMFTALTNAFLSETELIPFYAGRPILDKHKHFAMYRPSAFYLAQVLMDIPLAIAQVILYTICSYFMSSLNLTAGRFFTHMLILFFINMTMNGAFRFLGTLVPKYYTASQLAGMVILMMFMYIGYMIPYTSMHPWFFWIFWINPIAYGYKALLINEMSGQVYSCDGVGNSVPFGPGYDNWEYKTCTMTGAKAGQDFVYGDDYLRTLNYEPTHLWAPNFVALVGFFLLFTFLTSLAMELYNKGGDAGSGSSTKLYLPGKAPKVRTDQEEEERIKRQQETSGNMSGNNNASATGATFSWHHVNYHVPAPANGGSLQLLNDVSGIVKPGHLTALMGSSGAGKTTLLDVLARRKTIGKIDGRIYLNSEILLDDFERITAYCEQMDIHQPMMTIREAMRFSVYLRQDHTVSRSEKDAYVEEIIELLEMEDIGDAQIGTVEDGAGISVEERKRLTIGMELVSKPKLLFLDEPTSGLDAQSSSNIVRFLRKLANAGWPVLCTIHQPSAILFEHFDHLLLLVRGGRTAYYGEIGPGARTMIDYFESNGGPKCAPEVNPAEYILEVVGAGTSAGAQLPSKEWADIWKNSLQAKVLEEELESIHQTADTQPTRKTLTYATSVWTQLQLVVARMLTIYWRSTSYNLGRFVSVMFTALFVGFSYWKLSNTVSDLQNRSFVMLATLLMADTLILAGQPKFLTERLYFRREYASRFYGWIPFAASFVVVEIIYGLFFAAFFLCSIYWSAGLVNVSEAVGFFYIMLFSCIVWSAILGFIIASLGEHEIMAAVLNTLVMVILILFAGLMQPPDAMPNFYSAWLYWINPFHYYTEGLLVNEMKHLTVECKPKDLIQFMAPLSQTCGDYMSNFFALDGTGYIANPDAVGTICQYCPYKSGKEFYSKQYGWSESHQWRNFAIMIAFGVFNILVFFGLCFWRRKAQR
ncbi:ABC-2 type transporter-domain-containing protein [Phascolomyces articulosus]|uniref:ABC-2 type transporter-domain-containing protein n=1 Tax=Phascolomyces articulosus TaxID=60185 RepID=A0AAD5K117_9FUNG|nr:ABC-2 type transporter-domain-containing protein [Phascolomyces articulosus]